MILMGQNFFERISANTIKKFVEVAFGFPSNKILMIFLSIYFLFVMKRSKSK
jgi:hypothetical protein